jgi:hypothetical protein
MRSNASASSQTPSQRGHSSSDAAPIATCSSAFRHAGQRAPVASVSVRAPGAPHFGQKAAPWKIRAKHAGQLIVASRARQYGHRRASGSTAAPQLGQ